MNMPKKVVSLVVSVVFTAMIAARVWNAGDSSEPSYDGKTVTAWLTIYAKSFGRAAPEEGKRVQAEVALRHIGAEGMPYYLAYMNYEPARLRITLCEFYSVIFRSGAPKALVGQDMIRSTVLPNVFLLLGSQAGEAIPHLAKILSCGETAKPYTHLRAIQCLRKLGNDAVPPLVILLTNQDALIRAGAAYSCGVLATNARPAAPLLLELLNDADATVRQNASQALREMGISTSSKRDHSLAQPGPK
jgi:hypothetical protein